MLNQQAFENRYQPMWQRFEEMLVSLEKFRFRKTSVSTGEFPQLYAELCQQEAVARQRGYSHALCNYLQSLIARAHHQLYRQRRPWLKKAALFLLGGFPRALRRHAGLLWLSIGLFVLPAVVFFALSFVDESVPEKVLGVSMLRDLDTMYTPSSEKIRPAGRDSDTNFMMFGFYVFNNVGIDFRMFATGLVFGLGTLFFLIFNGVFLGVVAGYLSHAPTAPVFWGFVATHSAPELIAMFVSSVAGLLLGRALILPGRLPRSVALIQAAREAVPLIVGAAIMTTVAAVIEAWWSSMNLALEIKLLSGAICWALTILYLWLAGRRGALIDE